MVMAMVSESYGIEKYYESLLGSTSYLLRLIKYRGPKENERNLGIVPHTDKSFMSILHQRQVKGLEIKTKDGEWILVVDPSPSSSSFIVMAGDACMVGCYAHTHAYILNTKTDFRIYIVVYFTYKVTNFRKLFVVKETN